MRYFAGSVFASQIFQISRRSEPNRYLHLIAFIAHQYYRHHDALVDIILQSQKSSTNSVTREHKERSYANRDKQKKLLGKTLPQITKKIELEETLQKILLTAENKEISVEKRNDKIIKLVNSVLDKNKENEFKNDNLSLEIQEVLATDDYHELLQAKSLYLQNRIAPIIENIEFQADKTNSDISIALKYFREKNGRLSKNSTPTNFLKPEQLKLVYDNGFNISLYKMFLFEHLASSIKSGRLNLIHSYKYRPLDQYLISKKEWKESRDILL